MRKHAICAHRMIRQNRCAFVLVPAWVGQFIELNSFLSSDRVIRPSNAVIRPLKVNSNKLSASKADGSRFHHMVAVGTQVWVSWVRILCRVRLVLQNDFRWGGSPVTPPHHIFLGEVTVTPPPPPRFFWGRSPVTPPQIKVTPPPNRRIFFRSLRSRGGPRQLHFVLYIFATRYD